MVGRRHLCLAENCAHGNRNKFWGQQHGLEAERWLCIYDLYFRGLKGISNRCLVAWLCDGSDNLGSLGDVFCELCSYRCFCSHSTLCCCQSVVLEHVLFGSIVSGCCVEATFVIHLMCLWFTEHFSSMLLWKIWGTLINISVIVIEGPDFMFFLPLIWCYSV